MGFRRSRHCGQCVGKLPFAFPYAVNGVVHSGMGSYAHFHDALLLLKPFSDRELPGRVIIPVWLFLCALNTGLGSPVSGSAISALFHSFCM